MNWFAALGQSLGLNDSSRILLLFFVGLVALFGILYRIGLVRAAVRLFTTIATALTRLCFTLWRWLFSWAPWPVFGSIVLVLLILAPIDGPTRPPRELATGMLLLFAGVVTCLAYIHVDLERYEVSRGYKALNNPAKGQSLARSLLYSAGRVGFPLLLTATIAVAGGFALLNHGLYSTIGENWYRLGPDAQTAGNFDPPDFTDFLAWTLLHLLRVVDLLDIANSYNYAHLAYVHQHRWPAKTLLLLFKSFFTMVLLQQVFTAFRHTRLLSDLIQDFWSPHGPIHERARQAIGQYGVLAIAPLLRSVRDASVLTEEQRNRIAEALAEAGPVAVQRLVRALRNPDENVRAVAVLALGRLRALSAIGRLVELCRDKSETVRQGLAQTLEMVCLPGLRTVRKEWVMRQHIERFRSWLSRLRRWLSGRLGQKEHDPVERAVAGLQTLIADESALIRTRAALALGHLGAAAAPAAGGLVALAQDADDSVRCVAAEALGKIGGQTAEIVTALTGLLDDTSPEVRAAAAMALGARKEEANAAMPELVRLLQDAEEPVRKAAAEAIAQIGTITQTVAPRLAEALASEDNVVRAQTAEALGDIGTAAAAVVPALVRALQDRNDRVRASAARALGKIKAGAAQAVPALVRALQDADHLVCSLAAEALGEIGPDASSGRHALLRCLGHLSPAVRSEAARALGRIGTADAETIRGLQVVCKDEDARVRGQALAALAGMGQAPSIQTFLDALHDPHPQVQVAAVAGLRQRGERSETVTQALLEALADGNDQLQTEAALSLGQLAGPSDQVIEGLCGLLGDDTPEVQIAAADALGQFGPAAQAAGASLLQALKTSKPPVRLRILRAMALIRPPEAFTAFTAGLQDPEGEVRKLASAGLLLVAVVPEELLDPLTEALHDPEPKVRANVALALARQADLPEKAVALLVECTTHPDDGVRLNAARALQSLRPLALEPEMGRLLADPSVWIRLQAARFLLGQRPDDPRAVAAIREALESQTEAHRRSVVDLLTSLDEVDPAFLPVLKERAEAETEPDLRLALADLVWRLERQAAVVTRPGEPGA